MAVPLPRARRQTVLPYIQLFVVWSILVLATLALDLVPKSALFYGLSQDPGDNNTTVIYGFWIMAEIGVFFLLLVAATGVMSGCRQVPSGPG